MKGNLGHILIGIICCGIIMLCIVQLVRKLCSKIKNTIYSNIGDTKEILESMRHQKRLQIFIKNKRARWKNKKAKTLSERKTIKKYIKDIFISVLCKIKDNSIDYKLLVKIIGVMGFIVSLLMVTGTLSIRNKQLNDIITDSAAICLILYFIGFIVILIIKPSSIMDKIMGCLLAIYLILIIGNTIIQMIDKFKQYDTSKIIIWYLIFYVVAYSFFYAICKGYNKITSTILALIIYILVLFISGIYFGSYHLSTFTDYYSYEAHMFEQYSKNEQTFKLFWITIKNGIINFYVFPNKAILTGVPIFQYLVGKFTDIVLLGYIISAFKPKMEGLSTRKIAQI